jgi:nitrite reductase/ring-hydroxylating ferredoxin subunit
MGPASAQLLDELGYDPDDGVPSISDLGPGSGPGAGPGSDAAGDPAFGPAFGGRAVDVPDLPVGAILAARIGARRVAVARLGSGRLVIVDDECPHDGGRISDGFVEGEQLVCARHGWQLDVRNGRCQRACKLRE